MNRTTTYNSRPGFYVDPNSVTRNQGLQIAWDLIPLSYRAGAFTVKANGLAAAGATAITVDALPAKMEFGEILNFGNYAPVTVTLSAQANAGATSLACNALSGPIPSGTILDFTGAGEYARTSADAAAGATSISVEALDATIENADTATFNGGTIQARVTVAAAKGATSITVDELQFAVADNAEAKYGAPAGAKVLFAGTVMVQVAAGAHAGKAVPRALRPASETAEFLLATDAIEGSPVAALSGYGMLTGGHFFENLLPEADLTADPAVINSTWKTELGSWFKFQQYKDSRAA